jgi:RimJ/RimL family protein N-acetyltransferase
MQPSLHTAHLTLRPYKLSDARAVQQLAGAKEVADTTMTIPHPYPDGAAESWISGHAAAFEDRKEITFAILLEESDELLGTASLIDLSAKHARAELGYWVGAPHWGKGYCSEAVARLITYARQELGVTRIVGRCFARNPASARVMLKVGLREEGHLSRHICKSGRYEDILLFGASYPDRGDA